MSAVFNFQSLLTVLLLLICTSAYLRSYAPTWVDAYKTGSRGIIYKLARIGERLSPIISIGLLIMAARALYFG